MTTSRPPQLVPAELPALVDRIIRGECVLVLGPRVAVRPDDPQRRPLDELFAEEVLAGMGGSGPAVLRRVADMYCVEGGELRELQVSARGFYERHAATTQFHRDLAALPFQLCISASPDEAMYLAFEEAGKTPQRGHYNFREDAGERLRVPTAESPLVYHLFGHCADSPSLVMTEDDVIRFLVNIIKGTPPVPDEVRSLIGTDTAGFLFIGFGLHNWYLRVVLQVLKLYGSGKTLAFEDERFFEHPDTAQTVGFFKERKMVLKELQWEPFARQLREAYEAEVKRRPARPAPVRARRKAAPESAAAQSGKPKAFVSYASEDTATVNMLVRRLEDAGVDVWQDSQDLRAGDDWDRTLRDVIRKRVNYVIVVETEAMVSRREGVFHREINAALERQEDFGEVEGVPLRFVMPVRVGDVDLLSRLAEFHTPDVSTDEGFEELVASILEDWARRNAPVPA